VEVNGQSRHIASYLQDFLFSPQRARSPVQMLSGGERNRLLLARLFARPANVLVLDEPTNDLDIESLELLEQTLQEYPGTLLLVSHDRAFLDNVVTQTLAAEGNGVWREYVGGYADWLHQRPEPAVERVAAKPSRPATAPPPKPRARLSFKEQRELEALPGEIAALENEQREIMERMSAADYYRAGAQRIKEDRQRAQTVETLLLEKLERWEALESLATRGGA
jgi:ATP-binding cassette subfamily F protein uup